MATINNPTHRFEAVVTLPTTPERRVRVKGKIHVNGEGVDAPLHEQIKSVLAFNNLPTEGYKLTPAFLKVVKLPTPTTKLSARLNQQHDYISLAAVFADGRITLTWSRYNDKMSGPLVTHEKAKGVHKLMAREALKKDATIGDLTKAFLDAAQRTLKHKSPTFETFAAFLDQTTVALRR